jgi:hypothetical protein
VSVRARLFVAGLFVLGIASLDAQQAPPPQRTQRPPAETSDLPVRRVILYKSGVGYFEHVGSVAGNATVAIQFTTAQLNDVLQSLTALDLDGGSIGNISYNSVAPIAQRLAALRLPLSSDANRLQFYRVLRGARLDIRTGTGVTTGRLLSVEQVARTRTGGSEAVTELTVVSDDGAVRTIELTPATSVHLADRDVRDDLSSYLGIVASSRGEDVRRMVLSASGTGTRRLFVSYISEVPIWKSTYRLVLPAAGKKPVLQGWAVVDNTVGQDWTGVELSLVAGAPQSFVQEISQPYYAQRPVVPLPPAVLLQPQTHAPTLMAGEGGVYGTVRDGSGGTIPGATVQLINAAGDEVDESTSDESGAYALNARPGAYTVQAELSGFKTFSRPVTLGGRGPQRLDVRLEIGSLAESVTVTSEKVGAGAGRGGGRAFAARPPAAAPAVAAPPPVTDYMAALTPAATAQDLGDLFEYKLKEPVTIRKNESALVPILNAEVDAERVSLWSRGAGSGRPLRGVWLTNSSTLTLDGGSFSVVDGDAFAGQGLLESLKPGEKRLVSYGADLAVVVKGAQADAAGHVVKIVAHDGVLIASQEDRATWKYTARNEDASARMLIVEHPIRPGWTVGTEPAAAETSPTAVRYRLALPPKQEATLTVTERHAGDTTYRLADFDDRTITILVRSGAPEPSLRRALQPLIDKRAEVAAAEARLSAVMAQIAEIDRDQQRLRENMKALRGSAEEKALTQRYTHQLSDQEDKLAALRDDQKKATADRDARRRELSELAARMTFEISG